MTKLHAITLSRRGFLITGGATGLIAGFMTPALAAWDPSGAITPTAPTFDPTLWYSIDANGIVFKSMPARLPVMFCPAKVARRLPLSRTNVRVSPRLWIDTPANP